jgi:hypothetical protein
MHCALVYFNLVLSCAVEKHTSLDKSPSKARYLPLNSGSILSRATFWWMTRLIWNGYKSELKVEDLWHATPDDCSDHLVQQIEKLWSPLAKDYLAKKRELDENLSKNSNKLKSLKKADGEDAIFLKKTESNGKIKRPSLLFCIVREHYETLFSSGFFKVLRDICVLSSPMVLG